MAVRLPSIIHLPIVARELRLAARRSGTYWGRVGAGSAALALLAWALLAGGMAPGGAVRAGRTTFLTMAVVGVFSAMLTALRLAAPSIAAEKREGTLGLLFLTDLRPRDIVLGKLAVSSLTTFFQFLAAVPALAIPLLLGGVTAEDFIRLVLVLLNLMLLASAVGMFASALSKDERTASGLATILMILVLGAGPAVSLLLLWRGAPPLFVSAGFVASPAYACVPNLGFGSPGFWTSFLIGHAAAWGFLGLTCWLLPRVWRERPASAPQAVRQERWKDLAQGDPAERGAARRELLSINPILWLHARDRTTRWHPWVFLAAVGALLVWARLQFDGRLLEPGLVLGLFWMLHASFKTWVASQAAHALSADRDRGALELVLSTPLAVEELLRGHWLALRLLFAAPLIFLLAVEVIWVALSLAARGEGIAQPMSVMVLVHVANVAVLALDVWAAGWVGLWAGVTARNGNDAAGRTQMRVFWLPWMGVMLLQAIGGAVFNWTLSFPVLVFVWAVLGLLVDLIFAGRARRKLTTELRAAAMLRAAGQPVEAFGWLARAGRWLGLQWAHRS